MGIAMVSVRKVPGRVPNTVRPHLAPLIKAFSEHGYPTTDVVDVIADHYGVSRSAIWKLTKLRSGSGTLKD